MTQLLWVCLGGAIGSGARFLLSNAVQRLGAGFPLGTLAVNLIGSFLVAIVMIAGAESTALSPNVRVVLTAGVLGGFTTYSAFSYETTKLLMNGEWPTAVLNVVVTTIGCLVACVLGWLLARWLFGS